MRKADSNQYHLTTLYPFDAPIDAIWDAILNAEAWPSWWTGVERVVTLEHGDPSGLGARRRCTCKRSSLSSDFRHPRDPAQALAPARGAGRR